MAGSDHLGELHNDLLGRIAKGSQRVARHRAELEGDLECLGCGRRIDGDGSWHSTGLGGPEPYCAACSRRALRR
jgi:hypothetical protein